MTQRILGFLAGGVTVAAAGVFAVLWLGGRESDPKSGTPKSNDPVSVVIEQTPLAETSTPTSPVTQPAATDAGSEAVQAELTKDAGAPKTTEAPKPQQEIAAIQTQTQSQPVQQGASDVRQPSVILQPQAALDGEGEQSHDVGVQSATGTAPVTPSLPTPTAPIATAPDAGEVTSPRVETPLQSEADTELVIAGTQEPTQPQELVQQKQPEPSEQELAAVAPTDDTTLQMASQPEQTAQKPEPQPTGPEFDVVRVDSDGQTVIAGRAAPDEQVEVLIDGEVVGEARADASGHFVAVVFANLSDAAQKLELRSTVTELSVETPVPEAEQTAKTEPEAAIPEPTLSDVAPQVSSQLQGLAAPLSPEDDSDATVVGSVAAIGVQRGLQSPGLNADAQTIDGTTPRPVATAIPSSGQRFAVSNPVIILPSSAPDAAPTLVQPQQDELAVLQPVERDIAGVVLDSISYNETGDVILSGRGVPGRVIRIYANGIARGVVRVGDGGSWRYASTMDDPAGINLFRMDEIGAQGEVTSRIETPFEYSRLSPQIVRERRVVIQKGDMLWRIAEQFYGDGIRYSNIYGANSELIRDPDLIYPGQEFTIPELVDAN